MLEEFVAWFVARWRELIPQGLRRPGEETMPALLAEIAGRGGDASGAGEARAAGDANDVAHVVLRDGQVERPLGALRLSEEAPRALGALLAGRKRPSRLLLRVGSGVILDREVTLPIAAERDLANVLRFEMDRLTPFSTDEILYSHEVVRRDRATGRLGIRLVIARRDVVEPLLALLSRAGLSPQGIEGRGSAGLPRVVRLIGGRSAGGGALLPRIAWVVAALLAIEWVASPFLRQQAAMASSRATIARLAPEVAQANALRARITAATAGADVMTQAQRDVADPVSTLALVTKLLPDDTYLTDLTLTGRKLTMNGQSASAAKLIGALAADPTIHNPSFVAPVTRLEAAHTDLFSIKADVQ